jgi:hypothetical protein
MFLPPTVQAILCPFRHRGQSSQWIPAKALYGFIGFRPLATGEPAPESSRLVTRQG